MIWHKIRQTHERPLQGVASGLYPEACRKAGETLRASFVAPFGLELNAISPPTLPQFVYHKSVVSGLYPESLPSGRRQLPDH